MIEFNGTRSTALGAFVERYPPRPIPQRKGESFSVPGRSGDIQVLEDAWENVEQTYEIYLSAEGPGLPFVANGVTRWLTEPDGYCRLEDEYDRETFRMAVFRGPQDLQNILNQFGRTTLKFECMPQRWLKSGQRPITLTAATTLHNPTGHTAFPLLTLHGSGPATLSDGARTLTLSVTDGMQLDCQEEEAWLDSGGVITNLNGAVSGSFPRLGRGDTTISWTGGITGVELIPRWYEL